MLTTKSNAQPSPAGSVVPRTTDRVPNGTLEQFPLGSFYPQTFGAKLINEPKFNKGDVVYLAFSNINWSGGQLSIIIIEDEIYDEKNDIRYYEVWCLAMVSKKELHIRKRMITEICLPYSIVERESFRMRLALEMGLGEQTMLELLSAVRGILS